jgi:predicted secreted acid phosphatase
MFKSQIRKILIFTWLLLIIFLSFSFSQELKNLEISKKRVENYYQNDYEKDLTRIISKAEKDLDKINLGSKPAIVFDVDETALSNYAYIKSMGFGYESNLWNIYLEKADAPAIDQTKKLYEYARQKKIHIIFLTGRDSEFYNATLKNLKAAGYNKFDTLICKSSRYNQMTAGKYKELERINLTSEGYQIIMSVGDQESDLNGQDVGDTIKLPNYMYLTD